jgi:tetratricopeptide (TPR) repeat protein
VTGGKGEHDELFELFAMSARMLARSGDAAAFLDWIARHGPAFAPEMARGIDPRTGPPGLAFRAMGVAIYGAMPLPEAGFQCRRLPEPGRNDSCLCGSGRKYKHCCLRLRGILDLSGYNMLRHILDSTPKKRFAWLPGSRADPLAVADTARQWHEEGDDELAAALLEPWFAGDGPLEARLEPLFDQLMDCYFALGRERKRTRLIARALERGDRVVRVSALQRRATILADRGDLEGAWRSFGEAQREDPEDPNLATLELTLLVSRGKTEQARERARFWIAHLERRRDPALADLIGFLRKVHADPDAALGEVDAKRFPGLERLAALAAAAPAPQARYAVADRGEAGRVLEPQDALKQAEARWRKVFPQAKPDLTATQHDFTGMWIEPASWLDWLERDALAWQSFDVLDDLAMAVDVLPTMGSHATPLEPLLERGAALLEANLAAAPPGNGTLQWGWIENRPALRMLAHLAWRAAADMDQGASGERFAALAERLIALNPADNHFMREPLTRTYLVRGSPEKALALAERYPDDFCGPTLNRILALVRLGRRGEALVALRDTADAHRVALEMLLAEAPSRPKPDPGFGVVLGGKKEAWEYRAAHRALWERDGALDWLRAAWAEVRRGLRPYTGEP